MNELAKLVNNYDINSNKLYLLKPLSDSFGFFSNNGNVIFGHKTDFKTSETSISTDYLDMELDIYIESMDAENKYDSGYYDLLVYKGDLDDIKLDIFVDVCESYAKDPSSISFGDFFTALVDIFREHNETDFGNYVGFAGELLFMKHVFEKTGFDITNSWHRTGTNSIFDFCFPNFNIEVKTTTKEESVFHLKHAQIFNNQKNYIAIVSIFETGEGDSVSSLCNYFKSTPEFSGNVKLQICIAKELSKIRKSDKYKFSLDSISLVDSECMRTITNIPGCISKISYDYDFSDTDKNSVDLLETLLAKN